MSLRKLRAKISVPVVLVGLLFGFQELGGQSAAKSGQASGLKVEGPFQSQNLAVYLVRGKRSDARKYVTLDEAMREKTVVLRERGAGGRDRSQVNELEIENKSDQWLYIQAGDVIQGGKQDRTIGTDVAIPPHSPSQPISAFCVEHGRWTARGGSGMAFESNTALVGSNKLKRSIQGEKSQTQVWAEVASEEGRASQLLASPSGFGPAISATGTYNAIVQNREIRTERADYVNALLPRVEKASDAVGIVVAINGEITAADVYGSSALFHRLARKLVESYALEALLARKQDKAALAPPMKEAALSFLIETSRAAGKDENVAPSVYRTTRETQGAVVYEYTESDKESPAAPIVLHKNFVKK